MLPKRAWRFPAALLFFLALIPLPLIDEIVGKRQFEKLCRENAGIHVDRAKAAGRAVYLAEVPFVDATGTWVRVVMRPWRYVDAKTGETVVSYTTLQAAGGRFVHMLPLSEGRVPLTFSGHCGASGVVDPVKLFKELGITQIQRSELKKFKESK
jgi:hypothetical protein